MEHPDGFEVRSYFVRHRNALLTRADFGELYVDYYLHLAANEIKVAADHDRLFKETLAALTLHLASRPHNEMAAWTVNLQAPPLNLFVTGDNQTGGVTGKIFTENIKRADRNFFYADVVRGNAPARRSAVEFTGSDIFAASETYYRQSEQRPSRFFPFAGEDYVMVSAQPDCDLDWLTALTDADIRTLDQREQLSLLEQRRYRWHCGCDGRRIASLLAPSFKRNPEELFGNAQSLRISCPRCGSRHTITREAMEAFN
ncbi:MAG: disulfide bond chaperone [Verrucomicrobiales bacterium]|jgi:molecular chaperone Hsp33|nr:disulfide bond chaperone [Verrucomicrobiales bacterium]